VFVGLYWQQYGWIAPGEEFSGLEDEYRLAPRDMPKLIYLKRAREREAARELLEADPRRRPTSYKTFAHRRRLADSSRATSRPLLAERFDASRAPATEAAVESAGDRRGCLRRRGRPPAVSPDEVLGRETDS
jgi:hypothetical protein